MKIFHLLFTLHTTCTYMPVFTILVHYLPHLPSAVLYVAVLYVSSSDSFCLGHARPCSRTLSYRCHCCLGANAPYFAITDSPSSTAEAQRHDDAALFGFNCFCVEGIVGFCGVRPSKRPGRAISCSCRMREGCAVKRLIRIRDWLLGLYCVICLSCCGSR